MSEAHSIDPYLDKIEKLENEVAQLLVVCEAELLVLESQLATFDQYEIDATLARAFKVGLRKRINILRAAINRAKGEQTDAKNRTRY